MKAWRVHRPGAPGEALQLDDVDTPVPGAGEVQIRVSAITLNFNDLEVTHRTFEIDDSPLRAFSAALAKLK